MWERAESKTVFWSGAEVGLGEAQPILTPWDGRAAPGQLCLGVTGRTTRALLHSHLDWFAQRFTPVTGSDWLSLPSWEDKGWYNSLLKSSSIPVCENNEERKPILRGLWCVTGAELWDVNEVAEFHLGIAPTLSKELVCDSL